MRIGVILLLLTGCALNLTDVQADRERQHMEPFITTDQDVYHAEPGMMVVAGDTIWYLEFTIHLTYTNRSEKPVYVLAYRGEPLWPVPPRIERLTNGSWQTVYDPPTTLVLSPRKVSPGEAFTHTVQVRAYDPQARVWPAWLSDEVEGLYRIHFSNAIATGAGPEAQAVPLEQRISNTFWITGTIPWVRPR